jgi:hypothetical protein
MRKLSRKINDNVVPVRNQLSTTPSRRIGECRNNSVVLDRGEWSASRPAALLPSKKNPQYQSDLRLGRLQSMSGWCGDEKVSCPETEPRSSSQQLIALPTELSRKPMESHEKGIQRFRDSVIHTMNLCGLAKHMSNPLWQGLY